MSLCGSRISLRFRSVLLVTNEVPRGASTTAAARRSFVETTARFVVPLQRPLRLSVSAAVPPRTCIAKCTFRFLREKRLQFVEEARGLSGRQVSSLSKWLVSVI